MTDKKKRDKWADLMVEQYKLEEKIKETTDIQEKSILEMDLEKLNKKLKKIEEDLFNPKPKETYDCRKCAHGLLSINVEPCKTCFAGENKFVAKADV